MFCVANTIFKGLILLCIMTVLSIRAIAAGDKGIVIVDSLNIRSLPGTHSSVIGSLSKGAQVDILGYREGWLKIRHGEKSGYIRNLSSYVYVVRVTDTYGNKNGTQETLKNYREKAEKLSRKIEFARKDLQAFSMEETALLDMLHKIDIYLADCKKRILLYRLELTELENELQEKKNRSDELQKRVASLYDYAKKRLVVLYKINRSGTVSILASADSFSEFLVQKNALERIFAHDEEIRNELIHEQARLDEVLTEIETRKQQKMVLDRELKRQIGDMVLERKKREDVLADIRRKKSLNQELIEAYQQAAITLENAIATLNTRADDGDVSGFVPDKPFEAFKGLLNMPVSGTITSRFGPYKDKRLNVERFNSGISVRADRGEPIHAVKDGLILYAGWFKGYGKMIIIDHGRNYYTVYAHAEELFKDKGDSVESGEVIATVGDSGSISGPELYFEVRHYGKPVDPLEWIRKG